MRYLIFALLFCIGVADVSAQEVYSSSGKSMAQLKREQKKREEKERKQFSMKKLIVGGGFGLNFGAVTNIAVSPVVGYRFTDKFAAGVGLSYQYLRIKEFQQVYNNQTLDYEWRPLTANVVAPSIWARYIIWNNIFVHAEYQHNFMTLKTYGNDVMYPNPIIKVKESYNQPAAWLGGGVRQPVTDNVSIVLMGLYNVIPDPRGIVGNNLDIRIGVNTGF